MTYLPRDVATLRVSVYGYTYLCTRVCASVREQIVRALAPVRRTFYYSPSGSLRSWPADDARFVVILVLATRNFDFMTSVKHSRFICMSIRAAKYAPYYEP